MRESVREMVFDRRLGKLRALNDTPTRSSAKLGWRGYLMEIHALGEFENLDVIWTNHVILLQLKGEILLEYKEDSRFVTKPISPGQFSIRPAQSCSSARTRQPSEFLTLSIDPTFMAMACGKMEEANVVDLVPHTGQTDRLVEGISLALQDELAGGGRCGRLYTDSLVSSLALHLSRRYGDRQSCGTERNDRYSVRSVRQAIEFIQANLNTDLSLQQIAASVRLSPFHFARLFKRATGYSPYQFVLKLRIERAKHLLMRRESLAKVAIDCGFFDQSHFTAHFKRFCGVTPRQFASHFDG